MRPSHGSSSPFPALPAVTPPHPVEAPGVARLSAILALVLAGALVLAPPTAAPLAAQEGVIEGTVVEIGSGHPLEGARVEVRNTETSVVTAADGRYRIEGVSAGETFVRAAAPGYVMMVEKVEVEPHGRTRVDFRLGALAGMVDELVVAVPRNLGTDRDRGASAGHISGRELEESGSNDMHSALAGRVPGASFRETGGQAGSGLEILIRGVNTITGSNEPIFYLDGIRLTPTRSRGLMSSIRSGSSIDFIDPASIERVEILKGPTATVRYGADAAAGVVLIYTKH